MGDRQRKRNFISISSESESEEQEESEEEESDEEESSISSLGDNDSEWSANEDEEVDDEYDDLRSATDEDDEDSELKSLRALDDQGLYKRVIHLLKGGGDLESLKLEECKAYLREHKLRLTGMKAVCIQRIQDHWRIKDGGEKLYPRSSFTINCTGDVCKGDVVVFKQRVYEKFDKVTRTGNLKGKRTVAGRVVKESYGAAKQQHTFTVEVLWSVGAKKLPPLFPLLVKGRNLYRMKTFRQPWDYEAERSKVLAEKHKRGAAARHLRAMKKASTSNRAAKRQKHSHHNIPSPKRRRSQEVQPEAPRFGKEKMKRITKSRATISSSVRDLPPTRQENGVPPPMNHPNREAFNFSNHETGSTWTIAKMPPHHPYSTLANPRHHHHAYTHFGNPANQFNPRSSNAFQEQPNNCRQINSVYLGAPGVYRGSDRNGNFLCSTPGCRDQRDDRCFGFSCWRCCRRSGRRCHRHQLHP